MKCLAMALAACAASVWIPSALAQNPSAPTSDQPADPPLTPEMWFYQQQARRYDDPRTAVRRKAELRAAQRMQRIAALKWYGFSNARPTANPTPWGGVYSPNWTSGGPRPYQWTGGTQIVILPPADEPDDR